MDRDGGKVRGAGQADEGKVEAVHPEDQPIEQPHDQHDGSDADQQAEAEGEAHAGRERSADREHRQREADRYQGHHNNEGERHVFTPDGTILLTMKEMVSKSNSNLSRMHAAVLP